MKEKYTITTFHSTHLALKFEKLLKAHNITVKIIPVPRQISASCGLAGRFLSNDYKEVLDLIEEKKFEVEDIYALVDGAYYKK